MTIRLLSVVTKKYGVDSTTTGLTEFTICCYGNHKKVVAAAADDDEEENKYDKNSNRNN